LPLTPVLLFKHCAQVEGEPTGFRRDVFCEETRMLRLPDGKHITFDDMFISLETIDNLTDRQNRRRVSAQLSEDLYLSIGLGLRPVSIRVMVSVSIKPGFHYPS